MKNNSSDTNVIRLLKHLRGYKRLHQKEVSILDGEINSIRKCLVKSSVKNEAPD